MDVSEVHHRDSVIVEFPRETQLSVNKVSEDVPEVNNSIIVLVAKECLLAVTKVADDVPELNDRNSVIVAVPKNTRCPSRNQEDDQQQRVCRVPVVSTEILHHKKHVH